MSELEALLLREQLPEDDLRADRLLRRLIPRSDRYSQQEIVALREQLRSVRQRRQHAAGMIVISGHRRPSGALVIECTELATGERRTRVVRPHKADSLLDCAVTALERITGQELELDGNSYVEWSDQRSFAGQIRVSLFDRAERSIGY